MPEPPPLSASIQEPRTMLPNPRVLPRFAGIATFGRYPLIDQVPKHQQPVDWAIYGVPHDLGVTYRPGARFGPRAIRNESQYVKAVHLEHGIDLSRIFSMADAGDAPVQPFAWKETLDATADFARSIGEAKHTRLLALGGDHSIAYANMKATWLRRGQPKGGMAVLHFDAHLDTVDTTGDNKWSHASPFRRAIENGYIDPKRMLSVGIRGPLNSLDDLKYAQDQGIELVRCDQARSTEGKQRIGDFLKRLGDDEVYLTFDIDVIDPAFAPGTGTPCPGGFSSSEAIALLRQCAGVNLVGADVVEVLPDRDVSGNTALLAAQIAFEILCIAAVRTKNF